ncbi:flagellar hook-length control protein FliK [Thermomonas fusca]|nr:flagellar hook-length control protein FliK [Thermomonas fusca]
MGETASLPLPSALPAAVVPAANATAASGTAAPKAAAVGTTQDAAAGPAGNPGLLFALLLGEQPEAAGISLAGALPAATRAAAGERQEEAPAADPLLNVLAQMPQTQQMPVLPVAPTLPPASVTNAAAAVAVDAGTRSLSALAASQPVPGLAAGADIAMSAPTSVTSASAGLPGKTAADTGLPNARAARLPLPQQGAANQVALAEAPLPGFVLPAAEQAGAPIEAAAAVSPAPLNALQSLAGVQPLGAPAAPVAVPMLSQPADPAQGYDDGFSGHVAWLAGQRIGQAEIRVVPEHLGAIDIRLQMDGSNVRAEFHSAQPEVRQALEASLPRLREMLGQHGLHLAHAGVGQGQGGQRQSGDRTPQPGHAGGLTLPDEAGSPLPPDFRRARGLLDVYA